jgi:hypothetical protein
MSYKVRIKVFGVEKSESVVSLSKHPDIKKKGFCMTPFFQCTPSINMVNSGDRGMVTSCNFAHIVVIFRGAII